MTYLVRDAALKVYCVTENRTKAVERAIELARGTNGRAEVVRENDFGLREVYVEVTPRGDCVRVMGNNAA